MTISIPLSLVTSANQNAADNSPVLWDGSDLVVSREHLINIVRLRSDLNLLMTKQAGYSSDFDAASKVNQQNIGATHDIESMHKLALSKVNLATKETSRIAETTKTSAEIMDEVEVSYGKLEPLLKEAESLAKLVKSGGLINIAALNNDDLSLGRTKLGEYTLVDGALDAVSFLPGKNVSINYSLSKGTYSLSFDFPKTSDLIKSGNMVYLNTNSVGATSVSVGANAVQALSGMQVKLGVNRLFQVGFGDQFLKANTDSGVFCRRNGASFEIGLLDSTLAAAQEEYVFRDGLLKSGDTIKIDTSLFPRLVKGKGATVQSTDSITTAVGFDLATADTPLPAIYTASYPLSVTKTEDRGILSKVRYEIDPAWLAQSSEATSLLEATEDHVTAIAVRANEKRKWGDLHEGAKAALACPILNLYRHVSGEASLTTGSDDALSLLQGFGAGIHEVELDVDLLPYVSLQPNAIGANFSFGETQEFDLYLILERHLRQRLKNPSFSIASGERGTKYKIVEVGRSLYSRKKESDGVRLYYNSELSLDYFGKHSNFLAACVGFMPPANWLSKTYGWPLRVTAGDLDYVSGKARNGQTSTDVLTFPATLGAAIRTTLISVAVSSVFNGTKYHMRVNDGYTNSAYEASFVRLRGYEQDPNSDYLIEELGQMNPHHVRLFCRLYANWKYNDADLNMLLFLLGQKGGCLANFASEHFTSDMLASPNSNIFGDNYVSANRPVKDAIVVDVDTSRTPDGKITVSVSSYPGAHPTILAVEQVLKQLQIPLVFTVDANDGVNHDSSKLFTGCC